MTRLRSKMVPHTNPDGSVVNVKLISYTKHHWPDLEIGHNVTLGTGIVVYGSTQIKAHTLIGHNVQMHGRTNIHPHCQIGDGCVIGHSSYGGHNYNYLSDSCRIGETSKFSGVLIDSTIGTNCDVRGSFTGTIGDRCVVDNAYNQGGSLKVRIGNDSVVKLLYHGRTTETHLHVGDHTQAFLGALSGKIDIGSDVKINWELMKPELWASMTDVLIPDGARMQAQGPMDGRSFIVVEDELTYVFDYDERFSVFDADGKLCTEQFTKVEPVLLALLKQRNALMVSLEDSQTRLAALRMKVGSEVSRLGHVFQHEAQAASA